MKNHPDWHPVKTVLQEIPSIFLARLARSCTKSYKSCTKNEAFVARYEKSCNNPTTKIRKTILLQDFHQILQENYHNFSCKILARYFISCKKFYILQENLRFCARLARYV